MSEGSQILTAGDLSVNSVSARDKFTVYRTDPSSPIPGTNHHAYVADSADESVTECARVINEARGRAGYLAIGVLDPDTGGVVQSFRTEPSSTVISAGQARATFAQSGLSFDSDDCAIYFGKDKTFRIMFTSDAPARLVFQCLNSDTGSYVTKFSCDKE